MTRFIFVLFVALGSLASAAQPTFLYETGRTNGQFVISKVTDDRDGSVSQVIICDAISVKTNGEVLHVTLKNVEIYLTKIPSAANVANPLKQEKETADEMVMKFHHRDDKVLFRNRLRSWAELNLGDERAPDDSLIFEGEELKRELKRRGLPPPPEADIK